MTMNHVEHSLTHSLPLISFNYDALSRSTCSANYHDAWTHSLAETHVAVVRSLMCVRGAAGTPTSLRNEYKNVSLTPSILSASASLSPSLSLAAYHITSMFTSTQRQLDGSVHSPGWFKPTPTLRRSPSVQQ